MVHQLKTSNQQEASDKVIRYPFTSLFFVLLDIENKGFIQGINLHRGEMPISHLFFANDILLFMKLNKKI